MSEMKERMHTGDIYYPNDQEIVNFQLQCLDKLYLFNQTRPLEQEKKTTNDERNVCFCW